MEAMLQKMKDACQTLTTSIVQPILHGMIESLALDVICDTKPGLRSFESGPANS